VSQLILRGGDTERDCPLKPSEVNHLRLMLAWMRVEYCLDEHMQLGYKQGAEICVESGFTTEERARELLANKAAQIRHVPQYVRQGIKMLTKLLREHEKSSGIVDGEVIENRISHDALRIEIKP
jgi:ribosomal protein S13